MPHATPVVLWFRRDLRLRDQPALRAACASGPVLPLFMIDPALWGPSGDVRRAWLVRSLRALDDSLGGRLVVRRGNPADVVPGIARDLGATEVHVTADFGVYGRTRDTTVQRALEPEVSLVRSGTPYAVAPGTLRTGTGDPYRVFSPFSRAWLRQGCPPPVGTPTSVRWVDGVRGTGLCDGIPPEPDLGDTVLPEAGEEAALARWRRFLDARLDEYSLMRNRPDVDGTSSMSAHLKYGEVHPRTLLADLSALSGDGAVSLRNELCWRDFYADVLWHVPESARAPLRDDVGRVAVDTGEEADRRFAAWAAGRTGYPLVDAGMRQLHAVGWMHNRVRMVVASFLVKDLHVDWRRGARYFMQRLRDGDLASNNQGWQWVAGTGTDPAPFFRIFNPVTQGKEHDPNGDYVRRCVPELRGVAGPAVHEPWLLPGGLPKGYPQRVVDHAAERREALARLEAVRA